MIAYTERVIRLCAAVLYASYHEYCLWYVPSDITGFARHLGVAMEIALGSRANVCKVLKMLDIIQSTRLQDLPRAWHDRKFRAIDYHPGRTGNGADWVYYDPLECRNISPQLAVSPANTTRVIPDDFIVGW